MQKRKSYLISIFVIIIVAVLAIVIVKFASKNGKVKVDSINPADIKYFVLEENNKYGVINADGNVIIDAKYSALQIPDPRRDVFITYESEDSNGKAINSNSKNLLENFQDVEAIEISQLSSYVPYEKNILKYKENNMYGLVDFEGKKITNPIYEEISSIDYKEGYLKVKQNGSYGVINARGEKIINSEYDNVTTDGYYNENTLYQKAGFILKTKTDDGYRYGYANQNGKIVLDSTYNSLERINEQEDDKNVYLISSVNGRFGLIKNNKQIIENDYSEIEFDRESNLLILNKNNAKGIANLDGKMLVPIDYDNILIGGTYISAYKENQRLVFDYSGNKIETRFTSYNKVDDNHAVIIDENNNYNIVDKNNNKLLRGEYVYIEHFSKDLYIATQGNRTGLISSSERILISMKYSTMQKIEGTNLLQATTPDDGRVDLINENGEITTGINNAKITKKDNYLVMTSNNERKYFDMNGKEITYQKIEPNNKLYASYKNGKWGFVDANQKVIVDYKYEFVTEFQNGVAGFKINGLWGVLSDDGKVQVEAAYQINSNDVKFLSKYYEVDNGIGVPMYSGDKLENED